jgi:hypothetical protein
MAVDGPAWLKRERPVECFFLCRVGIPNCGIECFSVTSQQIAHQRTFKMVNTLGFVVVASPFDWLFAKGCLASLRHFMPDLPVAVLIDGTIDTASAEKTYGVHVLRKENIPDDWLQRYSFGWGITKMAAIWHAPFERYVHLDADTVVWGDLCSKMFRDESDVIWSIPKRFTGAPSDYVNKWFFQPKEIAARWPGFRWEKYVQYYACTGAYALRRGCLKLQRYQELVQIGRSHPHLFKFGDMGMLNLMVFESLQEGSVTFRQADFQVIFPDYTQKVLRERFAFDDHDQPVVKGGDEQVLHMPDKKPLVDNTDCYSEPMTFFRLKYLAATEGVIGEEAMGRLRDEDAEYHRLRYRFLRREKGKKILGLLKGDPGEWRRLIAKLKHKR